MLQEIRVKPLRRYFDERGSFTELMRTDWKEILDEDKIVQANFSTSFPSIVRAWHRHSRGQIDYFLVLAGSLKICAYDDESQELYEVISSDKSLQIVKIPGQYWHGFKVVGNDTAYLIYFVNKHYDSKDPDEERRPWNDPSIIPKSINGRSDDERVGKIWDWFAAPHK
ncbi:MAG: dTDP-4-dehydrorhamnose 3,5-epimerase [Thermoproteota archaeon]|nr:dTDP-4-dehydrorhamnose 3,5-epimerase [Thermoproteota archaeon]